MNYFFAVKNSSPIPRVHPLLLSLAEVFKESETSPEISSISKDDPRVLNSKYYTTPSNFPPLDAHLSGQNGTSRVSTQLALRSHQQLTAENVKGAGRVIPMKAKRTEMWRYFWVSSQ